MIACACLSFALALSQGADAVLEAVGPERSAEAIEFLRARADSWDRDFPGPIQWSEWDENSIGAIAWSGYYNNTQLHADIVSYPAGVTRRSADLGVAGHRSALISSEGMWLIVERPIPDEPERPWTAVQSKSCPSRQWGSTMLHNMRFPLYRKTVSEYLRLNRAIVVRESADSFEIDFAATDEVAEFFGLGKFSNVGGLYGTKVRFDKSADWRPTLIRECFSPDTAPEPTPGAEPVEVPKVDFGGAEAVVLYRFDWLDWVSVGGVQLPTRFLYDQRIRVGEEATVLQHSVFESTLGAKLVERLPEHVSFALLPPESMGPVGRVSNVDTGEVRLYDSRTRSDRLASREEFVDLMTQVRPESIPTPPKLASGRLLRLGLLAVGMGMIGLALARQAHARKEKT